MIKQKLIISFYSIILFLFWLTNLLVLSLPAFADDFFVRPHIGVGQTSVSGDGEDGTSFHVGSRFLLSAGTNTNRYYGLEVTYIDAYAFKDNKPDMQYIGVGIVLEQKPFEFLKSFNMGIGTIGYIGIGDNTDNPFGIVTNLGWEPEYKGMIVPFISFRSEFIFDDSTVTMNTLSAGIRLKF